MGDCVMTVKGLCVGYRDAQVLDDVSLDIERGKVYSTSAPTAAGKRR
jgi:ABC-type transporter Mla maintaining outer membrane lipid asymmetry ATPase subunit MlaF